VVANIIVYHLTIQHSGAQPRASGNDMLDDSVLALPCFVCSTVGAKSLDLDSTLLVERLRVRKLRWDALSLPFHPHCRGA
jgi:hypothetical protein